MNAFVRQLAVLSILWALCELLLPEGRQQQMVRLTASVLVMTTLMSTAGEMIRFSPSAAPTLSQRSASAAEQSYRRTALVSAANQLASWCDRIFSRAGGRANARVFLHVDGSVDRIEISLLEPPVLMTSSELREMMAHQLGIEADRIHLTEGT